MMIAVNDQGMLMTSEDANVVQVLNLTNTMLLNMFNHAVQAAPEDVRPQVKEELYDFYNEMASAFLETFAPEIELRPNLTAEAILKAENEILDSVPLQSDEATKQSATHIRKEMEKDNIRPFHKK